MPLRTLPTAELSVTQKIVQGFEDLKDRLKVHQNTLEALVSATEIMDDRESGDWTISVLQTQLRAMERGEKLMRDALRKLGVLCEHCEGSGKADGGRECSRCVGRGIVPNM